MIEKSKRVAAAVVLAALAAGCVAGRSASAATGTVFCGAGANRSAAAGTNTKNVEDEPRRLGECNRGAGFTNSGSRGVPAADADSALLARLRRKDPEALKVIVARYCSALTRLAWLYLGDAHAAEDAVQEAFMAAWGAARRTGDATPLRPWLTGILVNRCRKQIRTAKRRRRRERRAAEAHDASAAAGLGEQGLDRLQDAMSALSRDHREVVILRYYEGLSVNEAGQVLGVPAGTVKSRCHAAITRLRRLMDPKQ